MAMNILGHSQIAVTRNIYSHVIPAMQQEAAGHMDAMLGTRPTGTPATDQDNGDKGWPRCCRGGCQSPSETTRAA